MRRIAFLCIALVANTFTQPALAAIRSRSVEAIEIAAATFWTVNDPFVGKWELNVARSTIVDEISVKTSGPNRYAFSFEGAPAETVVADGTDQPGLPGTTLSVRIEGPNTLRVMRKQGGQTIVSATWKLADNGRTLHDAFINLQPDGSSVTVDYVYKRISGSSGFAGEWESTTKPVGLQLELDIRPYESKGLTFVSPGSHKSVTFDGKEHAGSDDGMTFSGLRRGLTAMEFTEKKGNKVEHVRQFRLSRDGRTLTETLRTACQTTPSVLVFDRK